MLEVIGPSRGVWPTVERLRELAATPEFERLEGTLYYGRPAPRWAEGRVVSNPPRLNGLEQLRAFQERGVPCPLFTTEVEVAKRWVRQGMLVFGRRLYHTQGRDIVGPRHRQWSQRDYWVQVVPVEREWRIVVFDGRSIARGLKVQVEPPIRRMPVRNRKNGWRLDHRPAPPPEVRETAKKAVEAVGYVWGAVDLVESPDGAVFVLEVNLAPGMDNSTAVRFLRAVERKLTV